MKIVAVGDIMPGGLLSVLKTEYATEEVRSALNTADIRVGNFECAVEITRPEGKKYAAGGNTIFVKTEDVYRLSDLGIDIVSIANNHIFDLGPEGAYKAMEVLDQLGIRYCGAGRNITEARKPVIIEKQGKTYAFLAFADTGLKYMYEATDTLPGVNPLNEENVVSVIRKTSKLYDFVIVIPHWGVEYSSFPTLRVERLSKQMIEAGADLVLGGHTHRIQPIVKNRHKCIVYSLGNFVFPDRIINYPRFTWYPEDTRVDISSLPRVIGRCPQVEIPTIKTWYPCAYTGMMIFCSFEEGSLSISQSFVHMDVDSYCVSILHKGMLFQQFFLKIIGMAIKYNIYLPFYVLLRICRKLNSLLKF